MRVFSAVLLAAALFGIVIPELRGDSIVSSSTAFDIYGGGPFWDNPSDAAYGYLLEGTGSNGLDSLRFRILSRKPHRIDPTNPIAFGTANSQDNISLLYINSISIPIFDYYFNGDSSFFSFVDPLDTKPTVLPLHAFIVIKDITYPPVPPHYPIMYEGMLAITPTPEPSCFALTLFFLMLIPVILKSRSRQNIL